jgi:hypothetical protein
MHRSTGDTVLELLATLGSDGDEILLGEALAKLHNYSLLQL